MPPRVTYWTRIWDPRREALSREVDILRRMSGGPAPVVSFSAGQTSSFVPQDRVIRLSARRWIPLQIAAAILEPFGDLTHVFGEVGCWHLLRAVGRRPVVFTAAVHGPILERRAYAPVVQFVAETETLAHSLKSAGIDPSRISIVRPGVDLAHFIPRQFSEGRSRVVFASTPSSPAHFERRGIPLLVEAARACPEVDFVFLWRQWGDQAAANRALAELNPPSNVIIDRRDAENMATVYAGAHAVAWMGADGYGKSCPNSVIEGLACGRPAIVSPTCGIADLIASHGAGLTPRHDPRAVAEAVRTIARDRARFGQSARELATREFSLATFTSAYRDLYERLYSEKYAA